MNVTLLKGLIALVPVGVFFSWSVVLFFRGKTLCFFLQLFGAGCLEVVVLTHSPYAKASAATSSPEAME